MKDVIELRKGETYFHVAFFDKELSIPTNKTYIYVGEDEENDSHVLFMNAEGFVAEKEGIKDIETYYISYEKNNINTIVDKEHLIERIKEEHSPQQVATEYEYKFL
ncbi:MAG: hypothetical protein HND53_08275 [Proteobacteria bacterium]|nr:hypothetical protein [Pseudomonadota bacterium]NOG60478.1 hypothetical protein [Pseudomonadota bacterium]